MISLLKLLFTLVVIVVLLQRKINLGPVLFIDSVILGVLFSLEPGKLVVAMARGVFSRDTFHIVFIMVSIMFFENVLRKNGFLSLMLSSLKNLIGDYRVVMAIIPPIIGLLPSAGGALFSAPMVNEADGGSGITAEIKSFINYWYRHVWEYVFPFYPGVILATNLLDVKLTDYFIEMLPYTIAAILVGIPAAFYGSPHKPKAESGNAKHSLKQLMLGLSPIMLIIALFFGLKLDVSLAVSIALIIVTIIKKYKMQDYIRLVKEGFSKSTVIMVIGVMVFKSVLEATGAIQTLPQNLAQIGIPPIAVIILLPFITGLLTGITVAFVGISFPVLIALGPVFNLEMAGLAYVSGFAGTMLSPTHLCFVLTVDFFKANFNKVQLRVLAVETVILLMAWLRSL